VAFIARVASVSTKRGAKLRLRFALENDTSGPLRGARLTTSIPISLGAARGSSTSVATISAGASRSLTVKLRVGKSANYGTHKVKVSVTIGVKKLSRTVVVTVKH
jgi:hypothetical protein